MQGDGDLRYGAVLGAAVLLCGFALRSYADDTTQALNEISGTADRICGNVAQSGHATSRQVSGEVTAELNGLVKRLADLGIKGNGSLNSTEYEGVLQPELRLALTDVRACKVHVFDILQEKMIPGAPQSRADSEKLQKMELQVEEIKNLLERQNSTDLETYVRSTDLEQKYPLGFALFYSDGRRTLYYGMSSSSGLTFDPSTLQVTRNADIYCLNMIPVNIRGRLLDIHNICVTGDSMHLARINDVVLDIEELGRSSQGLAWVLGMKPAS
jgi:hypothetical protein